RPLDRLYWPYTHLRRLLQARSDGEFVVRAYSVPLIGLRHTPRRSIPADGAQRSASHALAQFLVAVAGKEFPQILSGQSLLKIALQKTLNRVRNFTRQTPVADWTSNRLMQTDCTADAEVVGILEPSSDFNFLAFNP